MADNLQDFLRKAAERRAQQQGGQPAQPAAPQPQQPQKPKPLPPLQQSPPQPASPLIEIYDTEEVSGDDIAAHVTQHLDTSDFNQRSSRMGNRVTQTKQDERLHQVFDHEVGRLSHDSVTDDAYEHTSFDETYEVDDIDYFEQQPRKAPPNLITELFRSPQSVVQAFIFSEIIKPPTDRWER